MNFANDSEWLDLEDSPKDLGKGMSLLRFEKSEFLLCDYGCGREGKFLVKGYLRCCCDFPIHCKGNWKSNRLRISKPYGAKRLYCIFCDDPRQKAGYIINTTFGDIYCCSESYIDCDCYKLGIQYRIDNKITTVYGHCTNLNHLVAYDEFIRNIRKSLSIRPNNPEKLILNLLDHFFPGEYIYSGDFSVVINGKNPDFICQEKMKIIEFFGEYWHSEEVVGVDRITHEEERKNIFNGYDVLIIWGEELKDLEELNAKLIEFHRSSE